MNIPNTNQRVRRTMLRDTVEAAFDGLNASYVFQDGFFVEAAIIEEAIRLGMDYIVLCTYWWDRWKQLRNEILKLGQKPGQLIRENTGIEVEAVTDTEPGSTNR